MICDKENPDALIYYVWPKLAECILRLDERLPKVWSLSDRRMYEWVKPTRLFDQMRCVFWSQVYDARAFNRKLTRKDIVWGLMSEECYDNLIANDGNLAYLVRPILRIEAAFEDLIWRCVRNLSEMCKMPRDFMLEENEYRKNYLSTLFSVMHQCEVRLGRKSRKLHREQAFHEITEEMQQQSDAKLNALKRPDSGEMENFADFDLQDLEEQEAFEMAFAADDEDSLTEEERAKLAERGKYGGRSNKGDGALKESEGRLEGADEGEEVFEGGDGEDQGSPSP